MRIVPQGMKQPCLIDVVEMYGAAADTARRRDLVERNSLITLLQKQKLCCLEYLPLGFGGFFFSSLHNVPRCFVVLRKDELRCQTQRKGCQKTTSQEVKNRCLQMLRPYVKWLLH